MKIYFRATIWYDITRSDVGSVDYEYSLDEFDKTESPSCGFYQYSEFDIPESYSEDEAEALCLKMIREAGYNGLTFNEVLRREIKRKDVLYKSMKDFDAFQAVDTDIETIHISVCAVNRGSFNDERLIESLDIKINDIKDKGLYWLDLYLGKKSDNKIKIAPVYLEGRQLYLLKDDGDGISIVKKDGFSIYFSDDLDESHIISTEIYCAKG